jgi:sugar O-acyltransferase (sialic acid O-acetyltransferase NeuD family)
LKPLVLFGAGEIAEVACFYLTHDAGREVLGFTVDAQYLRSDRIEGRPVVAFEEIEQHFAPDRCDMLVATSYAQLNRLRAQKCQQAKERGYRLISYVSTRATTWPGLEVGENCFILEDNTIQPYARIGNNVTLWSGNHIGHHSSIGDNCFISSHVVVSGGVTVKESCFVGVNATIRDHVTIGSFSVIGAGALVLEDTPDYAVLTQPAAQLSKVPSNRLRRI